MNAQLKVCPWLDTRAIDVRSCDPAVEQIDFFDVPVVSGAYDVVVCVMVVNCVPDVTRRAEMLVRCRDHLRPGGLLFFAVPSRCVDMSAFLSRPLLEGLLDALGFETFEQRQTPKISFYILRRRDGASVAAPTRTYQPRIVVESSAALAVLRRLRPPVRPLPPHEQPVTGVTKTEFAMPVPEAWVTLSRSYNNSSNGSVPVENGAVRSAEGSPSTVRDAVRGATSSQGDGPGHRHPLTAALGAVRSDAPSHASTVSAGAAASGAQVRGPRKRASASDAPADEAAEPAAAGVSGQVMDARSKHKKVRGGHATAAQPTRELGRSTK